MKIFISADMEGTSGLIHREHVMHGTGNYERFRKLMTLEINAAVSGAIKAGADEIVVNDSHGSMRNIMIEELHPEARLITGFPKRLLMMEGIDDSYDGVIFTGYHAMANSEGVLCHTIFGSTFSAIRFNGVEIGESAFNAAIAGHFGVPVLMVSGDDKLEQEVKRFLPQTMFAKVKESRGYMAADCLSPQKARERIEETAYRAVSCKSPGKPFDVGRDIQLEFTLKSVAIAEIAAAVPGMQRTSALTVSCIAKDILEVVRYTTTVMYASCVLMIDIFR